VDLPNFQSGQRLFASQLQQLKNAIQAATIQKGTGYTFERSSAGTRLRIEAQTGGSGGGSYSTSELLPFQVIEGYPSDPAFPVMRVQGESYFSSIETGELIPIAGNLRLGAIVGSEQDNADDPGQFSLPNIGESVWLECSVDGITIASATLKTGVPFTEGWLNYPDPIEMVSNDPFTVSKSRVLIAHVVYGNDPRHGNVYNVGAGEEPEQRKVLQQLRTHIGVQVLMMRGIAAPVIVPWHGPFIVP
jgi:hypothetical protein